MHLTDDLPIDRGARAAIACIAAARIAAAVAAARRATASRTAAAATQTNTNMRLRRPIRDSSQRNDLELRSYLIKIYGAFVDILV